MSPFFHSGAEKATSMLVMLPSSPERTISTRRLAQRVVLVVEGLHHHQTRVAVDGLGHGPGLVGVGREGLLAQDVLAGPQGGDRPVAVQPVREGVVDGVDVGVVDQFGVRVQHPGDVVLRGECLGPGAVAGRHGGHLRAARPSGWLDQSSGGDAGRPQDADPQHAVVTGAGLPIPGGAVRAAGARGRTFPPCMGRRSHDVSRRWLAQT